jgi:nucleoside-diphosphate-sugar epimerase
LKFLVTGASGFIGSHIVERLVADGHTVVALVSPRFSWAKPESKILQHSQIQVVPADLTDPQSMVGVAEGVAGVFHCAAIARPMSVSSDTYFRVNHDGSKHLFDECLRAKVQKVILLSSVAAIGPMGSQRGMDEKSTPNPIDDYGKSKQAQEAVAHDYLQRYGLPIVTLRPPTVYGPRDKEFLKMIHAVQKGIFPIRSGKKCIEYIYVRNLVDACVLVFEKAPPGETYLVRDTEMYSLNEILGALSRALKKQILPIYVSPRMFSLLGWVLEAIGRLASFTPPFKASSADWMTNVYWNMNISKIEALGYQSTVGLQGGVDETTLGIKK